MAISFSFSREPINKNWSFFTDFAGDFCKIVFASFLENIIHALSLMDFHVNPLTWRVSVTMWDHNPLSVFLTWTDWSNWWWSGEWDPWSPLTHHSHGAPIVTWVRGGAIVPHPGSWELVRLLINVIMNFPTQFWKMFYECIMSALHFTLFTIKVCVLPRKNSPARTLALAYLGLTPAHASLSCTFPVLWSLYLNTHKAICTTWRAKL